MLKVAHYFVQLFVSLRAQNLQVVSLRAQNLQVVFWGKYSKETAFMFHLLKIYIDNVKITEGK